MSKAKRNALFLLVLVGLLVVLLAMSFRNLALAPGQSFSLPKRQTNPLTLVGAQVPDNYLEWVLRGMLALTVILLFLNIVFSFFSREGRQRLLTYLVLIMIIFFVADYLRNQMALTKQASQTTLEVPNNIDQLLGAANPESAVPTSPPAWLTAAVLLAVSLLVAGFVLAVAWLFWQRRTRSGPLLEELAKEAQQAIRSIQTGGDLTATILRCYQEMSRVVAEERGITRETFMTPREFEAQLVSKGLPPKPVETLTRLFEQVRYGSIAVGAGEESQAVACLTDIVNAAVGGPV